MRALSLRHLAVDQTNCIMAYEQTVDSVALSGHLADVLAAAYSPDGSYIVTAGALGPCLPF